MLHNFSNLSHADFEDLVRDLLGGEIGVRFESFGAGPDGGADGRHATAAGSIIVQAKHYAGSPFSSLKTAMKRERVSIDALAPRRYILATSRALTRANKAELASIIGTALRNEDDIFNASDLSGLLRKFPDIEKSHIKLWLSSTAVLERVIRSAAHSFTTISRSEIETKVRVYAQNPSLSEARTKLETHHVAIISGPPGVGKTTLAEMLAFAYIADGWEFIAIRSLEDGFSAIVDAKKQVFFFDDFLGKVALDARALSAKDSDLAKFIRRVQKTPNARFILTTRAYIFEEARRISEHLADERLDITKYALDVGIYTRRIKARILYNHLFVAETPWAHVKALWDTGTIAKIVDHRNYNPRIIEAMTDSIHSRGLTPEEYPSAFLKALNKPRQIWDTAFRTHIQPMCRHLLFALFFCSEYGAELDELKMAFNSLHSALSAKYGTPYGPKDFEEALKILEGGFISISAGSVRFVNPSLRDYLTEYLDDTSQLSDFARAATKADWAASVWKHVRTNMLARIEDHQTIAACFSDVAKAFVHLPIFRQVRREPLSLRICDLSNSERISLLLTWAAVTGDIRFSDYALALAKKPISGFNPWLDGTRLVDLVREVRDESDGINPNAEELATALEAGLITILENGMPVDDLEKLHSSIERSRNIVSQSVFEAASAAIEREFENASSNAAEIDSESTLTEQIAALQSLASSAGISAERLNIAVAAFEDRISEIAKDVTKADAPSFTAQSQRESDVFDDAALQNLFEPLTHG